MKRCFRCGETKPPDDFYPHPAMADGRLGKCKECARQDVRANRAARRAQYSAYDQARYRTAERRETQRETLRRHRRRWPERTRARQAVANALRSGRLERLPCEVCGNPASEAHHADYSKPLDVSWLCFQHHRERHGQTVTVHDYHRNTI